MVLEAWGRDRAMPPEERLLIPLGEIDEEDLDAVGPKAAGLGRLLRRRLAVPEGFCLTTAAYRAHLWPRLAGRLEAAVEAAAESPAARRREVLAGLRSALRAAPLPDHVARAWTERAAGLEGRRFAVRSSGTAEDLPTRSFAGVHATTLEVEGSERCLRAVRECWASLWSEAAFVYRQHHGIEHRDAAMAVIVQAMVPAEVSGVVFSVDPLGDRGRLVIEAAQGCGGVVSGRRAPERRMVRRDGLRLERREGGGGPRWLAASLVRRIAELALEVERISGGPVDVEWAVAGGEVWLLQVRPITTTPRPRSWEDRQVWTNANAGEVLPDVVTPMTFSVLEPFVLRLFGTLGRAIGARLEEAVIIGLVAGRVYFNLNTVAGLCRNLPFGPAPQIDELFGGQEALRGIRIPEEDLPDIPVSRGRAALGLPALAVRFLVLGPGRGSRFTEAMRAETGAIAAGAWRDLPDGVLVDRVDRLIDGFLAQPEVPYLLGFSVLRVVAFYAACRRWFGSEGEAIAGGLLAGLGTIEHAAAGTELWNLAGLARAAPAVEAALRRGAGVEETGEVPGGAAFAMALRRFLDRHGHHTRGEVELFNPRWSDDPACVLEMVRNCLEARPEQEPRRRSETLAARRTALAAACRRRLPNPFLRAVFGRLLKLAQRGVPVRENLKNEAVRRLGLVRALLLELGRRGVLSGRLERSEDVFFLRRGELRSKLLAGAGGGASLPASRRAEYERNLRIDPPPVVRGRFDPERAAPPPAAERGRVLRGVAVSPGLATGPARVILRAGTEQVRPGEVLVAPFTDPGWTPYFLNAAAIVTDSGGLLSHGSIIAREYGIPCVANVGPATRIIATARTVRVDGNRGIVTLLEA